MAGKKLSGQTKIKASTLLEVVVSMVIIVLVFGIAMMIYANVMRLSLSAKKIKAQAQLQEILLQAEQINDLSTRSINQDDLRIELEVKPYNNDTLLYEIHLTAYDSNQQKITELQTVINK